jgi:hypothetical protein
MRKIITGVLFLGLSCYLHAQQKISFSSQNYVGILTGGSGTGPLIHSINGIRFGKWFTGVGSGVDWYYQRSVPLFFSAERGFRLTPSPKIYFSSGAGIHFPWPDDSYSKWGWGSVSKTYPGFFWNAGLGYRIPVSKNNDAVLLHFGYSNKLFREKVITNYFCINPPCPGNIETYKYNLRAVSLKLGYGF